jgi:hypothetical protein
MSGGHDEIFRGDRGHAREQDEREQNGGSVRAWVGLTRDILHRWIIGCAQRR